jgi:hypothetical protein
MSGKLVRTARKPAAVPAMGDSQGEAAARAKNAGRDGAGRANVAPVGQRFGGQRHPVLKILQAAPRALSFRLGRRLRAYAQINERPEHHEMAGDGGRAH